MEPASLFDPQRSIWKVLPLRPQPEPLESITGYITRLAEANGLQSINELGALAGGMIFYIRHAFWRTSPDYPAPPYPGLAQLKATRQNTDAPAESQRHAFLDERTWRLVELLADPEQTSAAHRLGVIAKYTPPRLAALSNVPYAAEMT